MVLVFTINSTGKNANSFFSYGLGFTIKISNSIINRTVESSAGRLLSTYTGPIGGSNFIIITTGSCVTLATYRGEGFVRCNKCIFS